MDTGVAIFPTHDAITPAAMARLAEERGHESLFFPEHTHIPASRESAWPGGGELPRRYAHTFDLFVAVTAAVTVTTRLRVGRACWTGYWRSATRGSPTMTGAGSWSGPRNCARGPTGRSR
jgi:alkanesulfonate monooxygenase SsuD/methylene tetrahydromethanopterin reductase-like flavin-dependent oxidoreductase (luciferase family)